METVTIPDSRGVTLEDVWVAFREVAEWQKETDRQMKETGRQIQETKYQIQETNLQMKETDRRLDKQLGRLGNRFGEIVEYMVMPNLVKKFRELGFVFDKAFPHAVISDHVNNIFMEIDITLENGDKVMIVEVKSKPTTEDITDHIERMNKIRARADLHNDRRKYLGTIAGMIFNENEKIFALKNGFYVVEPSGETFTITAPEGNYSAREW